MAEQSITPDADVSDGSWTTQSGGTSLFDVIDEFSADDNDFIMSSVNPSSDVCKIRLSNPAATPLQPVTVRYRYKSTGIASIDLTVRLLQGATQIAEWVHSNASKSFTTANQALTSPQFAAISDFTDLNLEFTANVTPVMLLDGIANLGPVYSMRKLLSAYAGNCVRIRRSSDNTEQNFGFSSNVVDTAGIASFVGGGTGYIVTWYDQNGNAVDVTQSTANSQPVFIASGINSLPTARFDGTDDCLIKTGLASGAANFGSTSSSALAVLKQTTTTNDNAVFGYLSDFFELYVGIAASSSNLLIFDYYDSGSGRLSVAQPSGWEDNNHVFEVWHNSTSDHAIFVDGTSIANTGNSSYIAANNGAFRIGAAYSDQYHFTGDISELVFIKSHNATSRETIRRDGAGSGVAQSMGSYFGITVS